MVHHNSGKTTVGAAEAVYRLLGIHPYKKTHRPPIKLWACSQDLPGKVKPKPDGSQETHKQLEQLRKWIPKEALRGGAWEKSFSPGEMTLSLANGALVVFKGYDQGPLKFESDAVHAIWLDEEPDDPNIWTSCLTRLADFKGQWWMTFTPVLSLYGKGWVQRLWEARNDPNCQYECFELFPKQNKHLSADTLEQIYANLTEEERRVREEGAFALLGGRVLAELTPDHYFDPYELWDAPIPPAGYRHWCVIDPGGVNATAGLFGSADDWGNVYLWGEHYVKDQLPEYHVTSLHAMWRVYCDYWGEEPPIEVLMDPAGWSVERTLARGKIDASVRDEYERAAKAIGATWLDPRKANNEDRFAWRVKRYLAHYRLWISKELQWWRWEAERWRRVLPAGGTRAQEHPEPEAPIDRDDHLMSCFVAGTLVETESGPRPIETLKPGDRVWTREGLRPVQAAWETGKRSVITVRFSDGKYFTATPDHPVWVEGRGWVSVDSLRYRDKIQVWQSPKSSSLMASSSGVIPTPRGERIGSTTIQRSTSECKGWAGFTKRFGNRLMVLFQTAITSITRMATRLITRWRTWSAFPQATICESIIWGFARTGSVPICFASSHWLLRGQSGELLLLKGKLNFERMVGKLPGVASAVCSSANGVTSLSRPLLPGPIASAQTTAGRNPEKPLVWMMRIGCAATAAIHSASTAIRRLWAAPVSVVGVSPEPQEQVVYNLQVADTPEYFANGVLVHNCSRYLLNELPDPLPQPEEPQPITWERIVQEHQELLLKRRHSDGGEMGTEW